MCNEQIEEDNEITSCPNCVVEYDDADADFLICHVCGYNANTKKIDLRKIERKGHQDTGLIDR